MGHFHIYIDSTHAAGCRVLIGELDEALDQSTDLSTIRAEPIPPIRY